MSDANAQEHDLRRNLDEAHRQLAERDRAFLALEKELHEARHREVAKLEQKLKAALAWSRELEEELRQMKKTRSWRFAARLQSLAGGVKRLVRRP